MTFIASHSRGPRIIAGALTITISLAVMLASYAVAAGWIQPPIAHVVDDRGLPDVLAGKIDRDPPPLPATTEHDDAKPAPSRQSRLGADDGYIPDGEVLSPWDTARPAIANLDPDLLDAVQQAAIDAEHDGIVMVVNSGWRSERYQQALLDEAIATHGSEDEARKWVASPQESSHVSGNGVDIGDTDADYWLIEHGNAYGLCQTYANEIWHFELAVAPGETCPPPLRDATESARGGGMASTSR